MRVVRQRIEVRLQVYGEIGIEDDLLVHTVVESEVGGDNDTSGGFDECEGGVKGGQDGGDEGVGWVSVRVILDNVPRDTKALAFELGGVVAGEGVVDGDVAGGVGGGVYDACQYCSGM